MALSDRLNLVGGEVPLNELRAIVDLLAESASRYPYLPSGGDVGAEIDAMITAQLSAGGVVMVGSGNLAMTGVQAAMRYAGVTIQGAGNAVAAGSNGTMLRRSGSNTSPAIEVQASGARIEKMRLQAIAATETLVKIKDNPQGVVVSDVRGFAAGAQSRFLASEGVTGLTLTDVETLLIGAVSVIQLTAEAHTSNAITDVKLDRCRIGGNAAADLIAAVGNVGDVRLVSTDLVAGRNGWSLTKPAGWDALASGSRTNPVEYQFDLMSWSGQAGHCSYWDFGRRIVYGSATRSSNTGDATGHVFRRDVSDLMVSGSAHHRGFGRSGFYVDGTDINMSGTRIANWGNLSSAANARAIGGIADSGGFVQLTIAVPTGRRQFDVWEWIRIESATGGLNGDHKITAVSGTTVTLATAFNASFSVTSATARPVTAGVHIGPNGKDVDLNSVSIGRSDDTSLLGQWCFLNESDGYVVWRPGGVDAGESGITRWVPDSLNATAAAKILAQTGEHFEQGSVTFTTFGAAANLFVGAPNGVYAIVGFAARVNSATATIAAVRRTGTFTAGTPTVVVNSATWTRYMLSEPFLAKVGDGTTTDLGVRLVSNTGTPGTLDVRPIVMRLAPM